MPRRPLRSPVLADRAGGGRLPSAHASRIRPRRAVRGIRWRLLLWRVRFPVAALLLGAAAAQTVAELRPAPPWTVPVVVSAHDLAPGGSLDAGDLRVVRLPGGVVPSGAYRRPDDVVGRSLAAPAPTGLPIVDGLLAGAHLAGAGPPGTVVAAIRLADPAVAALLHPGDRIDLLASAGTADGAPTARRLADRALVLADPGAGADPPDAGAAGSLLGGGSADTSGVLTLVAVAPAEAAALAGSVGWANLSAVIVK